MNSSEQSDTDREIEVLVECYNQLARLDLNAQRRALWWLRERLEADHCNAEKKAEAP